MDTELVQQPPKSSPFDTFIATGVGRVKQGNGPAINGFKIEFTLVEAVPPGASRRVSIPLGL